MNKQEQKLDDRQRELMQAFPVAGKGEERWALWLPAVGEGSNESDFLLQLRVGKRHMTDGVNQYVLQGGLVKQAAQGTGYDYYCYQGEGGVSSTRIAVKGQAQGGGLKERLVWAETWELSYNSQLPVVVYTPESLIVATKVFEGCGDFVEMPKGCSF